MNRICGQAGEDLSKGDIIFLDKKTGKWHKYSKAKDALEEAREYFESYKYSIVLDQEMFFKLGELYEKAIKDLIGDGT